MIPFFPEPVSPLSGGRVSGKTSIFISISIGTQWVPMGSNRSHWVFIFLSLSISLSLSVSLSVSISVPVSLSLLVTNRYVWSRLVTSGFCAFYLCLYRSLCLCLYLCPYPCLYLYLYLYLYWLRTVAIATNRYRWLRTAAIATNRYRWLPLVTALPIAAKDKISILPIDMVGI